MNSNQLDIIMIDTYDVKSIGFADVSSYPSNFTVVNETFEITPPGFPKINVPITPAAANVYHSDDLGITDPDDEFGSLPDGIYTVKYTINPSLNLSIERSVLRVEAIKCKYYNVFLYLDLDCGCNLTYINKQKQALRKAKLLIYGAIASANKQDYLTSFKLYDKADKLLNNLSKCECN